MKIDDHCKERTTLNEKICHCQSIIWQFMIKDSYWELP